jgi:P4 family phage/plasmid primase-like protien
MEYQKCYLAKTGFTIEKEFITLDSENLKDEYLKTIDCHDALYEITTNNIKPFFDHDIEPNTTTYHKTIQQIIQYDYDIIKGLYPGKEIKSMYREYKKDGYLKKSLHHIVQGVISDKKTILEKYEELKFDKIFDKSVYKNNGLYPIYTQKKGIGSSFKDVGVKFEPIDENGNIIEKNDIDNNLFKKYLITYIEESFEMDSPPSGPEKIQEENKIEQDNTIVEKKIIYNYPKIENSHIQNKDNEKIKLYLDCLDVSRYVDYDTWLEIGMICKNTDENNFEIWNEWSKQSDKFNEKETLDKWNSFKRSGLTIGTLKYYAKIDNPEKYKKIRYLNVHSKIKNCVKSDAAHLDIADLANKLFDEQIIYDCITKAWYLINNKTNIWKKDPDGSKTLNFLGFELQNIFLQYQNELTKIAMEEQDEGKRAVYLTDIQKCSSVVQRVKNTNHMKGVITQLKGLLSDDDVFGNKFDQNINFFAFNNGLFDLKQKKFRKIQSNDYIFTTTDYDYDPDVEEEYTDEINKFLKDIQDVKENKQYLIDILTCRLFGKNYHQEFYIFTGHGANGKSVLFNLLEQAFGKYFCKFQAAIFTKGSRGANETSSFGLARKSRIVGVEEPDTNDKLIVSRLKEYTGDSTIKTRGLYQDEVGFTPQFGIIFLCNEIPSLSKPDKAVARRLRVLSFNSKFVDTPNPNNTNEKKIDRGLEIKFKDNEKYKQAFAKILFENWNDKIYKLKKLNTPKCVVEASNQYMESSDLVKIFINENYEITEFMSKNKEERLSTTDLLLHFKKLNKDAIMDAKGLSYSLDEIGILKHKYTNGMKYFLKQKEDDDSEETTVI